MSKKLVALVLAFALVFSTFTAAFAAEALPADAQAAVTLGMLKGDTTAGVTTAYLATAPSRLQAAILYLRLKGLEQEALAYTSAVNFTDANTEKWEGGRNIMAYLKNHPELGWQGDNGYFKANDKIKAQDYYKVMLEALGYKQNTTSVIGDFTYDQTIQFAASKGLTKVADVTNFTVAGVATATIEALKANVKGSTKTLAASLVEAKILNEAAAIAAGVYTAAPVALAVTSVSANNLKQITVTFNKEVDKASAETAGNYVIATSGTATMGTAALQADKKTVVITLATKAAQQEAITLTVKNVKDAAGVKMTSVDKDLTFLDFTLPVAEKIELTGPKQLKITFNEPIDSAVAGSVLVENGIYGATPAISGNTVVVTLATTLTEGSYNVKVSGYKDYAGYVAADKVLTFNYVKDATNVVATVKEATQTYVIVEFNKAVLGTLTADNFYHTFTAWKPSTVVDTNGDALNPANYYTQVKLTFPANGFPIPAGTTKLVVLKAQGLANEVVDQWGNKMAEDATLAVTVAADTTAPTVTKVEATAENTVKVTFSEPVTGAATAANYTIKGADGKVVAQTITNPIAYDANAYAATLTLSAKLSGGTYTIEVKDIVDNSLAANKIATTTTSFAVTDKTPATVSAVVVENTTDANSEYIYVTYSEPMATTGAGSILDANNYQLDGQALPTGSKVEMFGAKTVKVTVPAQSTTLVGATRLAVGRVADLAGNQLVAFSTPVTIAADVAPVVTSVKTVALNKIEITVNGILTAVPVTGIKVDGMDADSTTSALAAVSFVTNEAKNTTTITGTLVANENIANGASKVAAVEIVGGKITSITGTYMAANANVFANGDIDPATLGNQFATNNDGIAPAFKAIAKGAGNTFTVQYDENLVQIAPELTATEFVVVDKDGKTLVANVDYTTSVSNDTITFTLAKAYVGKLTVSTKSAVTYFGDDLNASGTFDPASDNAAKAFASKEVTF